MSLWRHWPILFVIAQVCRLVSIFKSSVGII